MLELISIVASLVVLVAMPIQTSQICQGKISPRYKGTPQAFAAAFRKQAGLLIWLGAVFGVVDLVLIFFDPEPGEWIVKLVGAALWLGVAGVSFHSSQRLAKFQATTQGGVAT